MSLKIVVKSKSFRIRCIWVLILTLMLTGQKKKKKKPQASYLNSLIVSFIVRDIRIIISNLLACFKHY